MARVIFFDLDDTLIDIGSAWVRCIDAYLTQHVPDCPPDRRAAFLDRIAERASVLGLGRDEFAWKLSRKFPEIGRAVPEIAADLAARLPRHIEPDVEVNSLLYELAGRYTTAIISNGSGRSQRDKLARSQLAHAAGRVFISGELGLHIPGLFRVALAWARAEPEAGLMVSKHAFWDIFVARRLGMQTCLVGPSNSFMDRIESTLRIAHVTDLLSVLERSASLLG
jgi:FMN phosphatase YigB (HAD superfamily)